MNLIISAKRGGILEKEDVEDISKIPYIQILNETSNLLRLYCPSGISIMQLIGTYQDKYIIEKLILHEAN